ncbi:MAG: type I glutamate--ammonia ligase [Zestosphaera sp.]
MGFSGLEGLKWVELHFTDLAGSLRHIIVSAKSLSEVPLNEAFSKLDGSSVRGFTGIEESDLILRPDIKTLTKLPWGEGLGRAICGVYRGEARFPKDPRYVAERLDREFEALNIKPFVSVELEFFIFDKVAVEVNPWRQTYEIHSSEAPWANSPFMNRPKDGYYSTYPKDRFAALKTELGEVLLNNFGIEVEAIHHEVAATSQHEINFRGGSLTYVSDSVQTVKHVIRVLSFMKGCVATFMPKPIHGDNGSGMHVHVSLWRGGENVFYDQNDGYAGLSQEARYFIGGLLEHGRSLSALVNPTTNSYKRLVPGYEAPTYLAWSRSNRSAAVRIPTYSRSDKALRIEYRPPDPSANPYLATTAIVLAGLDGIRKKIDPGDPIDENLYEVTARRSTHNVKTLPRTLDEALDALESDNGWLKPIFPDELLGSYVELKRTESKTVNSYPTPVEFYNYLDI